MNKKITFLISRQKTHLLPSMWWIHAAYKAAEFFAGKGDLLIGSKGDYIHDFPVWAYNKFGGETIIIEKEKCKSIDVNIDRDKKLVNEADIAVAISVRNNGIMLKLGLECINAGKKLFVLAPANKSKEYEGNRILLSAGGTQLQMNINSLPESKSKKLITGIRRLCTDDSLPKNYLWHFTKRCSGPWPGQTLEDYFESIITNAADAEHSAIDALNRILSEKKIRASSRLIKTKYPVVSFTECPPNEMEKLSKYKKALMRWNYEPLGIGFPKELCKLAGIKPVRYLHPDEFSLLPQDEKYLYQKHLPPEINYSCEKEWRHLGDFNFSLLDEKEIVVYAPLFHKFSAEITCSYSRSRC